MGSKRKNQCPKCKGSRMGTGGGYHYCKVCGYSDNPDSAKNKKARILKEKKWKRKEREQNEW